MAAPEFTTEELATEEWRDVIGYEGIYSVSNLGRVRRDKPYPHRNVSPRLILKPTIKKGYRSVELSKNAKRKFIGIHSLVLAAFVGPCPPRKQVNHIDFVRGNNRLGNLEYLTNLENVQHSLKNYRRGEQRRGCKLTTQDVLAIRARYKPGLGPTLAREFGVSSTQINHIARRRWWAHV